MGRVNSILVIGLLSSGAFFAACGGETSDTPSGDGDAAPGDGDAAPGDGDAAPGDGDAAPGDGDAAPGDGDAAPGDGDAAPGDGDGDGDTGQDCVQDGITYPHGTRAPAAGCNGCFCEDGSIACTAIGCPTPPDACTADFEVGPCDAAFPVYWFNPTTGLCEERTYGGCDGNGNRYETQQDCMDSCGPSSEGIGCKTEGRFYPHGFKNVPDPESCNTCQCDNGQLTNCTEANCPEPCPTGLVLGQACAQCGLGGGCTSMETTCLSTCVGDADGECDEGYPNCFEGLCRNLVCI
jgi:hypothetical protein